jgi:hypothetical protein
MKIVGYPITLVEIHLVKIDESQNKIRRGHEYSRFHFPDEDFR